MATDRMNDGIYKMLISAVTLVGAGFFFDTLNSCGLKSNKQVKMMFVLLILVLYTLIDVWTADTIDLEDTDGKSIEGFYNGGANTARIARNGIPMITKGTRHELNEVISGATSISENVYNHNIDHEHPDSFEAMTIHERNFRHFMFAAAVSGLVIGVYTFAGAGGSPASNK